MKGLAVSSGIGMGKAFLYKKLELEITKKDIKSTEEEIERFTKAMEEAKSEIDNLYNISLKSFGEKEAEIFLTHNMMLEDPEFIQKVKDKINKEKINAEWAVEQVTNSFILLFESIEDEYLKDRGEDLKDVFKRVLRALLHIESIDLLSIDKDTIIIGKDLSPSDIAQINRENIKGIVTELGGKTSHTFIIARAIDIPIISGVRDALNLIKHGDYLIVDGSTGDIILNPSEEEKDKYRKKQVEIKKEKIGLKKMIGKESISKDGWKVKITGNIGNAKDIGKVLQNDGEGVGLLRTEFLYMGTDSLPTEEEQFKVYKTIGEKLQGKHLIIRTLDIGGDKKAPCLIMPNERNPFLGYRAIRFCLGRLDIFKTQLRAILRASNYGNIKLMLPMISSIEELRKSKSIVEEVKRGLEIQNIPFKNDLQLGIMVEIPAVAIHSKAFAKEVDFFSIGTNDLIQYTLAVDRGNQNISHLYSQYHPAVLRLIKMTIDNGHEAGISVGMCGEVATDKNMIPILLGMGLDEFSMIPSSILESRYLIRNTSKIQVEKKLDEILNLSTAEDVKRYSQYFINNNDS